MDIIHWVSSVLPMAGWMVISLSLFGAAGLSLSVSLAD